MKEQASKRLTEVFEGKLIDRVELWDDSMTFWFKDGTELTVLAHPRDPDEAYLEAEARFKTTERFG
jgi:hypothetical protein